MLLEQRQRAQQRRGGAAELRLVQHHRNPPGHPCGTVWSRNASFRRLCVRRTLDVEVVGDLPLAVLANQVEATWSADNVDAAVGVGDPLLEQDEHRRPVVPLVDLDHPRPAVERGARQHQLTIDLLGIEAK